MTEPCILCKAADCRHKRNDAALLAHRANPTKETKAALLAAMQASHGEFTQEQTDDFMERTT